MKKLKIGINGFGRIGRLVLRAVAERDDVEVVAINDPFLDVDYANYLFEYDSIHGKFKGTTSVQDGMLVVNKKKIKFFAEKDPTLIPWGEAGVQYVVEATGKFTSFEGAEQHLKGGAKKVVVSAPGKNMPMFIMKPIK